MYPLSLHDALPILTPLYSSGAGTHVISNPFTASSQGVAFWCAPNGSYDVMYSNAGLISPITVSGVILCVSCSGGGGGGGGGSGTVINVSTGTGVTGGPINTAGTISI